MTWTMLQPRCHGLLPHRSVRPLPPLSPGGALHLDTDSRVLFTAGLTLSRSSHTGLLLAGAQCCLHSLTSAWLKSCFFGSVSCRQQPCPGEDTRLTAGDTIWSASPLLLPARSGKLRPSQPGGPLGHHHCCAVTWLCKMHCTLGTWQGCRTCFPLTARLTCCWRASQLSLAGAATRGVRDSWAWESLRRELGWLPQEQRSQALRAS